MTHTHPEAIEYAAAESELQSMATGAEVARVTADPAPKAAPTVGGVTVPGVLCPDDDHDWEFEWPEDDVGFQGFKSCKVCGHKAALTSDDISGPDFSDLERAP